MVLFVPTLDQAGGVISAMLVSKLIKSALRLNRVEASFTPVIFSLQLPAVSLKEVGALMID
jgi:hypothetical protein